MFWLIVNIVEFYSSAAADFATIIGRFSDLAGISLPSPQTKDALIPAACCRSSQFK